MGMIEPGIGAVRTWAVNWLAGGDRDAAARCLADGYRLRIGAFTLSPRSAYIEATVGQLERYPGLGVTVHDILTDGRGSAVFLSEHGASTRHQGAWAAWRVVAVFEHDNATITRGWAEEDYWARRRQLASGVADPVGAPAPAPWTVTASPAEPGVEDAVRAWISAGTPGAPGVIRDDADLIQQYEQPASAHAGSVDALVVSGRRAGFHAVLDAVAADGSAVSLPVAGLVEVMPDGSLIGHLITDRLGLPRTASPS